MNHDKQMIKGFTLIELMLAMAFISMLLLAIAMTVLQIGATYNRGLTYRSLDQTSRTVTSDISTDMTTATGFSVDPAAHRYITQSWGGAMCLGQYSYVWNYGAAISTYNLNHMAGAINLITSGSSSTGTAFNLVKISDPGASMCASSAPKMISSSASPVELIQDTDHNLALHEFCIASPSSTASYSLTGQTLFTVTYMIGTNDSAALTTGSSSCGSGANDGLLQCKAPNQIGADLQYCADQEFSLVVRTQNAVN